MTTTVMKRFGAWLGPLCLLVAGAPAAGQGFDHDPWLATTVMPRSEEFVLRAGDLRFRTSHIPPPPATQEPVPGESILGGIFDLEWPAQVHRREGQWLWLKTPRGYRKQAVQGWVNVDHVVKFDAAVAHYTEQIADADTPEAATVYYWLRGRCLEKGPKEHDRDLAAAKFDYLAAAGSDPKPSAENLPPPNTVSVDSPISNAAKAAAMASLHLGVLLAQDTDSDPLDTPDPTPTGEAAAAAKSDAAANAADPPAKWIPRLTSAQDSTYLSDDEQRLASFALGEGYCAKFAKWCDKNIRKHAEADSKAKQAADDAKKTADDSKKAADAAADEAAKAADSTQAKKDFNDAWTNYMRAAQCQLPGNNVADNRPLIKRDSVVWPQLFYSCGALLLKCGQIPEDKSKDEDKSKTEGTDVPDFTFKPPGLTPCSASG